MLLTLIAIWSGRLAALMNLFRWLPPLLARLSVGWVFVESGWGKLHQLDKVTAFFESLQIPAPAFQAALVAGTEWVGGILLIAGLFSRLAGIPLSVILVVAIATAKASEYHGFSDLVGFSEYLYLLLLVFIVVQGPGALACDTLLARFIKRRT
jgi:putative oxidoreductase